MFVVTGALVLSVILIIPAAFTLLITLYLLLNNLMDFFFRGNGSCGSMNDIRSHLNTLLKNHYEAKKILCPMDMEYQKIHACPNDCILYKHEYQEMHKCPRCGLSQYKVKDDDECSSDENTKKAPLMKVLWYLPIIPRFKRLFANGDDAKDITCHANGRNCD